MGHHHQQTLAVRVREFGKERQNRSARSGIEVSGGFVGQDERGSIINARASATRCI
ncbi:hypothetical protein MSHI_27020 [Mycobacterium shinjukuense]|uniref:Uncharacterized protein n=1 Tax=Mycobacterium shinjukuense TaxID=398694 RepID=A0A7I7MRW0_9MYCO|nr:hypothetical protein MSHI_27020 [Mycobacterium shinjukuense]